MIYYICKSQFYVCLMNRLILPKSTDCFCLYLLYVFPVSYFLAFYAAQRRKPDGSHPLRTIRPADGIYVMSIQTKNRYRFIFLFPDTCFLFFCSLYSVLLDFLYIYVLFIFTFHYQVHFNDTFSSYHYKCSRSLIIYLVFENITGFVLYQFPL